MSVDPSKNGQGNPKDIEENDTFSTEADGPNDTTDN